MTSVRSTVAALLAASCVAAGAGDASGSTAGSVRVTFVGDSVPASIAYVPSALRRLRRGLRVSFDLRVCRRLIQQSCSFQGSTPTTALQAVQGYGGALGDVLIVNVGYNESADGYSDGIDRMMRAALAQGTRQVVWVTLRATRPLYRSTNAAIVAASRRWPQLVVADWNAYSRGRPWFGSDGLHLTEAGADALAAFLRLRVLQVAT